VLEAEALPQASNKIGQVDASARDLIDKSRPSGWHTWNLPAEGKHPAFRITFDYTGRHTYDRTSPLRPKDPVACDGKTMLHLYPQLHLGATRTVSRFHRADFAAAVPWYLPPADELARGADVKVIDEHTVAIVPHYEAKLITLNTKLREAFEKK